MAWCSIKMNMAALAPSGKLRESIGIEAIGGTFMPLIRKRSGLPASWQHDFSTGEDGQSEIKLNLFHGNTKRTRSATPIGSVTIAGIASMPKATPKILVELVVDASGVQVRAEDRMGRSNLVVSYAPA